MNSEDTNGLFAAIDACARRVEAEGKQYIGKDVLRCVKKLHPNLIEQVRFALSERELLKLCGVAAKRRRKANVTPEVEGQLSFAGFDKPLPSSIRFYDGEKTAFISVFSARQAHWLSHIKLQEDNINACDAAITESRPAIDLIRATGREATFGEALALNAERESSS
jgi:hypothetical protein